MLLGGKDGRLNALQIKLFMNPLILQGQKQCLGKGVPNVLRDFLKLDRGREGEKRGDGERDLGKLQAQTSNQDRLFLF